MTGRESEMSNKANSSNVFSGEITTAIDELRKALQNATILYSTTDMVR